MAENSTIPGRTGGRASIRVRPLSVAVLAVLALGALLSVPGPLAISEHIDPLFKAETLVSEARYREALDLLTRMDTSGLDAWEVDRVLLKRALCQKAMGRHGQALVGLESLQGAFGAIEDYLVYWQAECLEALGRLDEAADRFAQVAEIDRASQLKDQALLRAAGLRLNQDRPRDAARLYKRLLGKSEREVKALPGLAGALEAAGDSAGARKARLQLVRDYPKTTQALRALESMAPLGRVQEMFYGGIVYSAHKKFRQAAALFRTIVRKSPHESWRGRAQYQLGLVYYDRGDYRTAERALRRAQRSYRVPKALFALGKCSVKLGRAQEAAERFLSFTRLYPAVSGAAESLWNAAMAYERLGRHREARGIFLRLASRYPKSDFAGKASWRAGFALYRMRRYEEAAKAFLRLAKNTPEVYLRDQGYYWAGKCYKRAGKEEEGEELMARATEGFPTSYYSARARSVLGVTEDVFPDAPEGEKVVAEQTYQPSPYLLKGDVLVTLGLYRMAEAEFARARRSHRRNLFALGDLKQRYERIGSMDQALRMSNEMIHLERRKGIPVTLASFRRLYPTYYWGEINRTAREQGLDPNLILAIIRQESAFNEEALSGAGARGLMQVMPKTAKDMARKVRLKRFSVKDLWRPQTSIRLGSQHLSDHLEYFRRSKDRRLGLALSAYNAGLRAASRWSRQLPS
ncbi:MAG: transglycosylase SLT domain-containing protein, partial [Candidatus Latescibacteria bacterium]|nr:transglycosylase SLT domain-containing protein [Candidatus Latescibacterota bacterium]